MKKEFKTNKELFQYLVQNKQQLLDLKKSAIKLTDECTFTIAGKTDESTAKGYLHENNEEAGTVKRTIVANTYLWLDSHDDVHMKGLFAKSIKDRGTRIPHLHDHKFELAAKVGNLLSIAEKTIKWSELGVSKSGNTEALIIESEILKEYNPGVYREYLKNRIDQHSVGMRYIKLDLAINDEDFEEEYKVWKSVIDDIGNKEEAEKRGYFWAVREAALGEVSAVLLGSNELTPTLGHKFQPLQDTETKGEPVTPLTAESFLKFVKL